MSSITETDHEDIGFTGFWTIENFSLCKPNKHFTLESESFEVKHMHNTKWYLILEHAKHDFLGIYLCKKKTSKYIYIKFSASIRSLFGWVPMVKNLKCNFHPNASALGTHEFIEWQKLQEESCLYLPNDTLTISFYIPMNRYTSNPVQLTMASKMVDENSLIHLSMKEFSVKKPSNLEISPSSNTVQINSMKKKEIKTKSTQTDSNKENVIEDLEDLHRFFREKKFCFVTLRSSNKDFAVHKALLCARSPVFNAMFDKDMKENDSNVVDIEDVDSDSLSLLLKFLHLEPLGSLKWDAAVKLYYAADKYQVEPLKKECVSFLKEDLSEENIGEALILADMHQDEILKRSAIEFFCKNSKTILRSTEWKELLLSRPELTLEILCELAEKM